MSVPNWLSFCFILECILGALFTASAEFAGSRFVIAVLISSEAGAHKNIAAARPARDNKIINTPKEKLYGLYVLWYIV